MLASALPHVENTQDSNTTSTATGGNNTVTISGEDSNSSSSNNNSNNSNHNTVISALPILDTLHRNNTTFDWTKIVRLMDQPNEKSFNAKYISVIFDAYHKYKPGNEYPQVTLFLGRWRNVGRQRCVL